MLTDYTDLGRIIITPGVIDAMAPNSTRRSTSLSRGRKSPRTADPNASRRSTLRRAPVCHRPGWRVAWAHPSLTWHESKEAGSGHRPLRSNDSRGRPAPDSGSCSIAPDEAEGRSRPAVPDGRSPSEPAWPDPETLPPRAARLDVLKLLVDALVGQVQRVGDPRHRLEAAAYLTVDVATE